MLESQPLIKQSKSVASTFKWSNCLSITFLTTVLGALVYLALPYISQWNSEIHGVLSPARIEAVMSDNGYTADAQSDLITSLPNLQGEMSSNMFSGYLTVNSGNELFYWFIESQSPTQEQDPLVLWTNGGPGCSGLVGLLTEHGPYWVYDDLSLRANDYSWNKYANMLYIEQPYGVGYSVRSLGSNVVSGDEAAVSDIDALVRAFLVKYPKYQKNDFYLASESYGGHYVPLSAQKILQNNDLGTMTPASVNLKGFLVGNPLNKYSQNQEGFMHSLFGHGAIKKETHDKWEQMCEDNEDAILYDANCESLYIDGYTQAKNLDFYALDYPNCVYDMTALEEKKDEHKLDTDKHFWTQRKIMHEQFKQRATKLLKDEELLHKHFANDKEKVKLFRSQVGSAIESNAVPYVTCNEYYLEQYLNLDEVQTALHAKSTLNSEWTHCANDVFAAWPLESWFNSMGDTYKDLVENYDINMLVYSGDNDAVCSIQGTNKFFDHLGYSTDSTTDWKEWRFDGQVAGFQTRYLKSDGKTAFNFQTVRSAGHMVPSTQPERSLELFRKYINGEYY